MSSSLVSLPSYPVAPPPYASVARGGGAVAVAPPSYDSVWGGDAAAVAPPVVVVRAPNHAVRAPGCIGVASAPEAPPSGAHVVGRLYSRDVVQLTTDPHDKYVVYERRVDGYLIAFRYHGWHTLRSVQSIAVATIAVVVATITGVSLALFTATAPGVIAIAVGVVGLAILGVGLWLVWNYNTSDPKAQNEMRMKALNSLDVRSGGFTTPVERREMLMQSITSSELHKAKGRAEYLFAENELTQGERVGFTGVVITASEKLSELENELARCLQPHRAQHRNEVNRARAKFNNSTPVRVQGVVDTALLLNFAVTDNRSTARNVGNLAYGVTTAINQGFVEREREQRDRAIHGADARLQVAEAGIRRDLRYTGRENEILEAARNALQSIARIISANHGCYSRSNLPDSIARAIYSAYEVS